MQNRLKSILVLFCLFPWVGIGQTSFYKIYTNNGYDFGQGVVQLEDSSYVVTGSSSSFQDGAAQAFLLKIDSLGEYKWSHDYGGIEADGGRRVLYKKNVGFFVAGYTNSIGHGGYDAYLVKTDESGNFLWEKAYGHEGWEKINDAVLLADTGIMMVGQTNSGTAGNDNFYIVRTDQYGDTLWTKNFGTLENDYATSVEVLNDSICIIAGQMYNEDSLLLKAYVMSIKTDGEVLWELSLGNNGEYIIHDFCIIGNEINAVGNKKDVLTEEIDAYVVIAITSGAYINEYAYPYTGYDSHELITPYGSQGKYYFANSQQNSGTYPVGNDLYVIRYDNSLQYNGGGASVGITNTGDDVAGQLISTNDGGALIVGFNTAFGLGGNNVFIAKIGSDDVMPNTFGVQSLNNLVKVYENTMIDNNEFKVYPNPSSTILNIDLPANFDGKIEMKDITGKNVFSMDQYNNTIPTTINIEQLEKGNYYISFQYDNGAKYTKMIVVF